MKGVGEGAIKGAQILRTQILMYLCFDAFWTLDQVKVFTSLESFKYEKHTGT